MSTDKLNSENLCSVCKKLPRKEGSRCEYCTKQSREHGRAREERANRFLRSERIEEREKRKLDSMNKFGQFKDKWGKGNANSKRKALQRRLQKNLGPMEEDENDNEGTME